MFSTSHIAGLLGHHDTSTFREFERGEFASLGEWLREHVHRWGRVFEPAELLERIVGGPLDAGPYLAYLRAKVEALESG